MATFTTLYSREAQLLLLGARLRRSGSASRRLQAHLRHGLDWERVLELARGHRVAPLLHRCLSAVPFAADVPDDVLDALQAAVRQSAVRGLRRERALVQVLTLLEEHDIAALPFKGPVLGERIYGDVALRPFGDLDLLVSRAAFPRARRLLLDEGFRPLKAMDAEEEATYSQREKSYELVRDGILVELHWNFLHPMHGFHLDPAAVWSRTQRMPLGGAHVSTLSPEDLLLYLCAHGGKHFWERLSWICDVAEVLHTYRDTLDWSVLMRRAQALNAERLLLLGLRLAADLLDAPCPKPVAQAACGDAAVEKLAIRVRDRIFQERTDPGLTVADALFHLKMRERLRDKWPYCQHLIRLAVEPTLKDRTWVDLRPSLRFAYYAVRPVRLLRDGLGHLTGTSGASS